MKRTETELFEMEKELIKKHFQGLEPREIEIVEDVTFAGRAGEKLQLNREYVETCTEPELIDLLKHELTHYFLPGQGHDKDFLDKAESVGSTIGDYEGNSYIDELNPMGFLEEVVNEDNKSATIHHHKKPQWRLFEDVNGPAGTRLKMLRVYTKLSCDEVASEAGISVDRLAEIEESEILGFASELDEEDSKRVFDVIASKYEEDEKDAYDIPS